ncbi:hypothetical protein CDL15_Pgr015997 [Punica granatum]|uniref:Defensin-like protein n=1 Tax=Punica granatum TaxID=22663 RepID=A0A218XR16_PUNGR|nr:hypothetical protein CDL15_Pgr015997 [Punica granatum]
MPRNLIHTVITCIMLKGGTKIRDVEGAAPCSESLGLCGKDCEARCSARHPGQSGVQGSCDYSITPSLCTCYYDCQQPPEPPQKQCTGGAGLCSVKCQNDCCNANCASKYKQGTGFCNMLPRTWLCQCQYACG